VTTVFRDIGAYRILREIGHGGMATVFLAEDTRHARQVALKLVSMAQDREGREILEAERWGTKLQERLAEACGLVPRVYEDGDQPPYYFIAMEYVHGENLSDVIARGPATPAEAVRIASALGRFLDTAHSFKTAIDGREFWSLVHGDLKPRNVRLDENGDIKVLDFGIAKALSLSRKVTRNDFGSMPYLSPERLDSTEVDAQADLWALGVILYEMLSGTPPFQAVDTRRLEQQIRAGYPRRPLPASCPVALQAIVARMLAADLAGRYESAAAVLADLQRFRQGETPIAETQGFPDRLDEARTRRTHPAIDDDAEKTRRTRSAGESGGTMEAPPPEASAAPAVVASPAPAAKGAAIPPKSARSHPVRTLLLLAALLLACNEVAVGFKASRIGATVATRDLDSMDDMWAQYDELSRHSYLRLGIVQLEDVLSLRVQALSEQVMANYRSTLPTVRERQWRVAQKNLQRALVFSPRNQSLKASLRYCEGHLHRIDGEAEKLRRRGAAARQEFTEAVSAFREAAELRRDWPDPFLGLARVFIYGLEDIDRAADAITQAQKLGYTTGDRETAQLADGYRARGESLWQTARQLADMPQEPEYLQRATDSYKQALELYERVPGFSGVAISLRRTRRALEQIEERVADREMAKDEDSRPSDHQAVEAKAESLWR
jgi:serine/threonine protein kinase